jgi:hypothetical protein
MSIYICHPAIHGFLAAWSAAVDDEDSPIAATRARTLVAENIRSVYCRFPEVTGPRDWPGPNDFATIEEYLEACEREAVEHYGRLHREGLQSVGPIRVLQWLTIYVAQSDGCRDHEVTAAAELVERIRDAAVDRLPPMGKVLGFTRTVS